MKRKGILLFAVLIFVLTATSAWANENSGVQAFPIEDSVRQAEHLMVGMFGYSLEEAKSMRYEAKTEFGSNATDVQVYPLANSDDHFDLSYLWDGSLIESYIAYIDAATGEILDKRNVDYLRLQYSGAQKNSGG